MRLGCIGLLVGIALTWGGGQQLYENLSVGERVDIAYADLVAQSPGVGWYRVTDATWQLVDAGIITTDFSNGANGSIYAPVFPAGQTAQDTPIKVLLHRENQEEAQLLESLLDDPDPQHVEQVIATDPAFAQGRPVEGMIEFGINSDSNDIDAIKEAFGDSLADEYIVITDGARPAGYLWPLAALLAGLALLGYMLSGLLKPAEPDAVDV
jgi:hypothetical protein